MKRTKVLIAGSKGRMGRMLASCAEGCAGVELAGGVDLGDSIEAVIAGADVVIDFSAHDAIAVVLEACVAHGKALVIGTTGHSDEEKGLIRKGAESVPVVYASNYSMGVNTLFWLVRKAAAILGPGFDLEVIEMHHRTKKDAPSGTAITLAEILAEARGQDLRKALRHGREGLIGERGRDEIGMHSLRGGDVVGDHTVVIAGNGERLELTHRASSRETFANGALRAAMWVVGKPAGLYSMEHVLGLSG